MISIPCRFRIPTSPHRSAARRGGRNPRTLLLLLPILIFLGGCVRSTSPIPDLQAFADSTDLMAAYLAGLEHIAPDRTLNYSTTSPEDRDRIAAGARRVSQSVRRHGWENDPVDASDRAWLDQLLVSRVWQHNARESLGPGDDVLRKMYEEQSEKWKQPDRIDGQRILIESAPDAMKRAQEYARRLRSGESFDKVAREYYATIDEDYDGVFKGLPRRQAAPELFDLFWNADPTEPCFGPVELQHGAVIGRTIARHPAGEQPFEEVRNRLRREWMRDHYKQWRDKYFADLEKRYEVKRLLDKDAKKVDQSTTAYEIAGQTRTIADVQRLTPGVMGNASNPAYYVSLMERAIQADLLAMNGDLKATRDSAPFHVLWTSLLDQVRFQAHVDSLSAEIPQDEEHRRAFYAAMKDERYRRPEKVRALVVTLDRNPDHLQNVARQHLASREAWQNINWIRAEFVKAGGPADFDTTRFEHIPGLHIISPDAMHPIDELGRLAEMNIKNATLGETTPVFIDQDAYVFMRLYEAKAGEAIPYDDVKDRVADDYRAAGKARITKELLGD